LLVAQECLEVGEKGCVRFRFQCHPEFLHLGAPVLFREGRTKGIGEITKLYPVDCAEPRRELIPPCSEGESKAFRDWVWRVGGMDQTALPFGCH